MKCNCLMKSNLILFPVQIDQSFYQLLTLSIRMVGIIWWKQFIIIIIVRSMGNWRPLPAEMRATFQFKVTGSLRTRFTPWYHHLIDDKFLGPSPSLESSHTNEVLRGTQYHNSSETFSELPFYVIYLRSSYFS